MSPRAEIVVDLAAIRHNVRRLRDLTGPDVAMMVVVKADGYGHGMLASARAARDAGAEWLGVATIDEALALREAGDTGRILCWLGVPGEEYADAMSNDVDVTAYSLDELAEIVDAAGETGATARVQLKVDTGLSRGGAPEQDWPALVRAARAAEQDGDIVVTGSGGTREAFSHIQGPLEFRRAVQSVTDRLSGAPQTATPAGSGTAPK